MKTYADVVKALEGVDGGSELVEALTAHIDTQKTESSRQANREAKNLREAKKALESRLKEVGEVFEVDLTGEDAAEKISEIKGKVKPGHKPGEGDPETKAMIKRLQAEIDQERKRNQDIQDRADRNLKKSKLVDLLTKSKVQPDIIEDLADHLSSKVKVVDGEKLVATVDQEDVTVDEYVTSYVKARPSIVQAAQLPGAGSKSGGGDKTDPNKTVDLSKMSPSQKMAHAFSSSKSE